MAVDYHALAKKSQYSSLNYYVKSTYHYDESNYYYEAIRVADEAISKNKSIEKNSSLAMLYNNRGSAKYNLGQYTQALTDFNNALKCEVDYNKDNKAMINDNIGLSYLNLKNKAMACKYFKQACTLGRCTNTWRCR
jgi:tetratricopeptide (TPR) repeat protein